MSKQKECKHLWRVDTRYERSYCYCDPDHDCTCGTHLVIARCALCNHVIDADVVQDMLNREPD